MILGSTGSIGTQAIDVVLRNPDRFRVIALSAAGGRVELLAEQAHRLRVRTVGRGATRTRCPRCARRWPAATAPGEPLPEILAGPDAATELAACACHTVLNGITGSIGLAPDAGRAGGRPGAGPRQQGVADRRRPAGEGGRQARPDRPGRLRALRALPGAGRRHPRRGPQAGRHRLRRPVPRPDARPSWPTSRPSDALAHPTWDMGPVVTINSATLVNKGLEVIEAHLLFDIPFDRIEVVVHPQSYIHSMVEFADGSTLAQASPPDMRMPIALGLGWPRAGAGRRARLRLDRRRRPGSSSRSTTRRSPRCALARHVGELGGTAPAVFNAANEECVEAFLAGRLPFTGIVDTVAAVVEEHGTPADGNFR